MLSASLKNVTVPWNNSDSITTDIIAVTSYKRVATELFALEIESFKAEYSCNSDNEDRDGGLDKYWFKEDTHFEFHDRNNLFQYCIDMTEISEYNF